MLKRGSEVVAQFLREQGLPTGLTFDNDPRFVGSPSSRDFPSALLRFLWCLGVQPHVIPPHRPDFCRLRRALSSHARPGVGTSCIGLARVRR